MTLSAVLLSPSRWAARDYATSLGWSPLFPHIWETQSGHIVTSWVQGDPPPAGHDVCVSPGCDLPPTKLVPAILKSGAFTGGVFLCPVTFLDSFLVLPLGEERTCYRRDALPELFKTLGLRYSPLPRIPRLGLLGRLGLTQPNPYYSEESFFVPSWEDVGLSGIGEIE
jgi:hypothetical protein